MKIKITKTVTFQDWNGTILRRYEVGEIIEATAEVDLYFITPMGGIYKDEAEKV